MKRFRFRLASKLGMTVSELKHRMTRRELIQWYLFDDIEQLRSEDMLGMLLYVIASSQGAKVELKDFMPPRKFISMGVVEDERKSKVKQMAQTFTLQLSTFLDLQKKEERK